MIAKLKGRIDSVGAGQVVIDVGGVGYLVFCPAPPIAALPAPGGAAYAALGAANAQAPPGRR